MSKLKFVSTGLIIASIYRNFRPDTSGWVTDAIEWIGEGLELVGASIQYKIIGEEYRVSNHKIKIPCNIENLIGIEFNKHKINFNGTLRRKIPCKHYDDLIERHDWTYYIDVPFIEFPFLREGKVIVYYEKYPTDDKGFPLIPDVIEIRKYLEYYVVHMMVQSGFKHAEINYRVSKELADEWLPRAQNAGVSWTLEDAELFKNMWMSMTNLHISNPENFFSREGQFHHRYNNPNDAVPLIVPFSFNVDNT